MSRRSVSLSLDETIVSEARDLNINLSRAAEDGIAHAVKMERERLWRLENAEAIAEMNDHIDKNGLTWPHIGNSDVPLLYSQAEKQSWTRH